MFRQFPSQYQILIPSTPVLLQKLFSHYSILPICRFFLIDFQIQQIIISMQCVAQFVLFIINLFLHILTTPFLCILFVFSSSVHCVLHFVLLPIEPSFQLLCFLTCPVNITEAHIPDFLCFVFVSRHLKTSFILLSESIHKILFPSRAVESSLELPHILPLPVRH